MVEKENNVPFFIAKQNLKDLAYHKIDSYIDNSNKCSIYKYIPKQRNLQQYLCKSISTKYPKVITKFRVSAHKLGIKTGRFDSINRDNRQCTKCNLLDIEDEYHFILKCPYYNDNRTLYIKPYFFTRSNVYKLTQLLGSTNTRTYCSLGKYLMQACERRDGT